MVGFPFEEIGFDVTTEGAEGTNVSGDETGRAYRCAR